MRRDKASKDELRALVGVGSPSSGDASSDVSGTISGTNGENGRASSETGNVAR